MSKNEKNVKLSDNDKKIIVKHSDVCTDTPGEGCRLSDENDKNDSKNNSIPRIKSKRESK